MEIVGSWNLVSFELEKDGKATAWGSNAHGLLIYAPSGHMSVSINKSIEADLDQSEEQNILDSLLFYAGTYRLEGKVIRHQVTNASGLQRIGKEMIRYASLEGNLLTLSTDVESFGRAILKWKRVG